MDRAARAPEPRAEITPRPWFVEEDEHTWVLFGGDGPMPLQILKAPKRDTPYAEYWPNAADSALIVAAPDLLAAAEALVADAESWETIYTNPNVPQTAAEYVEVSMELVNQLRAAIQQARGGNAEHQEGEH